jgi:hypothetical protein
VLDLIESGQRTNVDFVDRAVVRRDAELLVGVGLVASPEPTSTCAPANESTVKLSVAAPATGVSCMKVKPGTVTSIPLKSTAPCFGLIVAKPLEKTSRLLSDPAIGLKVDD